MPHSACNCRCLMCDIWKNNNRKIEWNDERIQKILTELKQLKTKHVVFSGGEALLHSKIFEFSRLFRSEKIFVTILTTGLLLEKYANEIIESTDEIIVSLDGSEGIHNTIRQIPNAYQKIWQGVKSIKQKNRDFKISARCVIQKMNFRDWPNIINSAKEIGFDQISFLAADITSDAFNHNGIEMNESKLTILPQKDELDNLKEVLNDLFNTHRIDFENKFIAESPEKLMRIYDFYSAHHGIGHFTSPKCNAPWVSAVIESDLSIRPCFFQPAYGNLATDSLFSLLNSQASIRFRKNLDVRNNSICQKCVCSLYRSKISILL